MGLSEVMGEVYGILTSEVLGYHTQMPVLGVRQSELVGGLVGGRGCPVGVWC